MPSCPAFTRAKGSRSDVMLPLPDNAPAPRPFLGAPCIGIRVSINGNQNNFHNYRQFTRFQKNLSIFFIFRREDKEKVAREGEIGYPSCNTAGVYIRSQAFYARGRVLIFQVTWLMRIRVVHRIPSRTLRRDIAWALLTARIPGKETQQKPSRFVIGRNLCL